MLFFISSSYSVLFYFVSAVMIIVSQGPECGSLLIASHVLNYIIYYTQVKCSSLLKIILTSRLLFKSFNMHG